MQIMGLSGSILDATIHIESHQFTPGSFLAWFRDSGFGFGNGRPPRFENQHYASPLNESTATINGVSTIDQAVPNALQASNLDDAMDSSHSFGSASGAFDFNSDFWQQRPKVEIACPVIHAEQAQALQKLIQAMGSFMHWRDDWIVIDDPVGPSKPRMEVLNLFGQS